MAGRVGVIAGGAVMVSACGSDPEPQLAGKADTSGEPKTEVLAFENVFECAKQTDMTQEQCTEAREAALAESKETAPRFAGQGDCEAEWGEGGCVEQKSEGRSYFSPFMTGFLISRALGGGGYSPLFRRAGTTGYATANGVRLGYGGQPGKYLASARALERPKTIPAIKADTGRAVTRGGMTESGSSGRSYGGTVIRRTSYGG